MKYSEVREAVIRRLRNLRYWLIEKLASDMPVCLNMNISRPKGYCGPLVYLPNAKLPALFLKNLFLHKESEAILTPTRDINMQKQQVMFKEE